MGKVKKLPQADRLRQAAEKKGAQDSSLNTTLEGENVEKLVHELRVHQIELEMQNDELRVAEAKLQESNKKYSELYDFAPVGYLTLDKEGVIREANLAAAALLNTPRHLLVNKPFHLRVESADQDILYLHRQKVLKNKRPQRCELRLKKRGHKTIIVQMESMLFEKSVGQSDTFRSAITDITALKEAEDVLKRSQGALEEMVKARTNELEQRTHSLEQRTHSLGLANKELEAFSFSVSHDLRNPLNAIIMNLEVLAIEKGEQATQDEKKAMKYIASSSERMAQVISDLIVLSGMSRKEMRFENTNLSIIAQTFFTELQASNPARNVQFSIQPDLVVIGDPGLMQILLENLIQNAWKFTSTKTEALLSFGAEDKDGKRRYFIRDNGVGFNMEDAVNLFKPYQRLHSQQDFKGTGLGLAIARRIVERHNGTIWAESEKNKGATIYFQIP